MPNKLLYKCKIGLQCLRYSYLVLKSGFEMCPPTSAIRSSEGFGEVMEAQTVARLQPNVSATNRDPDIQNLMEDA